jgi:hypothetical protein
MQTNHTSDTLTVRFTRTILPLTDDFTSMNLEADVAHDCSPEESLHEMSWF